MSSVEHRHIDRYFSDFMHRHVPDCSARFLEVMADLSQALSRQHSCLDLDTYPDKEQIITELHAHGLTADRTPVTLHGNKLYLHRYYQYEKNIVERLQSWNRPLEQYDRRQLSNSLKHHFPGNNAVDWQKIAALQALTRKLTIITGGPGTGKTSTVSRIITLFNELAPELPHIRLAAPTGKAAMRLRQSMTDETQLNPQLQNPELKVQTLHRLLGMRRDGLTFRFNADNPITADLLIIDEASMIDLPMMHRILTAIPPDCRLILVGDPNQLPSVDTGNVLSDLCTPAGGYSSSFRSLCSEILDIPPASLPAAASNQTLNDVVCTLSRSYRFSPEKGIGRLSHHIKTNNTAIPGNDSGIEVLHPSQLQKSGDGPLVAEFRDYIALLESVEQDAAILTSEFERTRILSPAHDGPLGVTAVNSRIEQALEQRDLKDPGTDIYHGKPILVTRNDYNLDLYNGDVGICIVDGEKKMVAFTGVDGQTRWLLASRLPVYNTCFAMTVHKSQGSEFDAVTLILPTVTSDSQEQLLNRELVYTAVTRAKSRVKLYCTPETWEFCMTNDQRRVSGITDFFQLPSVASRTQPETGSYKQMSLFQP